MDNDLFKRIGLTALDFWGAKGEIKKKNMALLPDDCWYFLIVISKANSETFAQKLQRSSNIRLLQEQIEKAFMSSYEKGVWIWTAEYFHKEPDIFKGKLSFNFNEINTNLLSFIDKWDALLDSINTLVPEEVSSSIHSSYVLIDDSLHHDKTLMTTLTEQERLRLAVELKTAVMRGYLLPNLFQYNE